CGVWDNSLSAHWVF
nr:immunoglobulin light chain junction region [Macaca mulatta]